MNNSLKTVLNIITFTLSKGGFYPQFKYRRTLHYSILFLLNKFSFLFLTKMVYVSDIGSKNLCPVSPFTNSAE